MVDWPLLMLGELSQDAARVISIGLILIVLALLIGMPGLYWLRRIRQRLQDQSGPAFTGEEIERLRASNQLTEEEFSRLRRLALGLDVPQRRKNGFSAAGRSGGDEGTERGEGQGNGPAQKD